MSGNWQGIPMARAPTVIWPRRVLVLSLLIQNPTAVETTAEPAHAGATTASWRTTAQPAPAVTTRARTRRRRLASATAAVLPEEILVWEIFVRLPSNDVLRCRAVCRYWHGLTSDPDFLLAHHRRQPSRLLLTRYGRSRPEPTLQRAHPILALDDDISFKIHASCDGLLLVSFAYGRFAVCNPATRQCAPLPCLTATDRRVNTAALYLHRPSGEYRVLYWNQRHLREEVPVYYIVTVRRGRSPRCIGAPSDAPRVSKAMMACDGTAPPVVLRDCLHWNPACSYTGILVFDTVAESFRLMRRPTAATRLWPRLCAMGGSIGFSCFEAGRAIAKIWVLEDYEREVWSFKYRVELPVESLRDIKDAHHLVLSHKGDILVYSGSYGSMLHCDNTGKLLDLFRCDPWSRRLTSAPWFKESLVKHDFFPTQGCAWVGRLQFF